MTYSPLDPSDAVVLFADLQEGIIERAATTDLASLRRAVAALAKLAQLFEIPAIVTTAPGGARVCRRSSWRSANRPARAHDQRRLHPHSDAGGHCGHGGQDVAISGVATEVIVQHSALSAAAQGWHDQVVIDACGGLSPRTEDAALRRLAHAGAVTTSVASIAGQLAGDLSQPKGRAALAVLSELASA